VVCGKCILNGSSTLNYDSMGIKEIVIKELQKWSAYSIIALLVGLFLISEGFLTKSSGMTKILTKARRAKKIMLA
jgi:hypothetical protein